MACEVPINVQGNSYLLKLDWRNTPWKRCVHPVVVSDSLSALERWIHDDDPLPPLVRAGLAHVQFETIHPFLDGNGRIGRLLITLLAEHWKLLPLPLLYINLAFKRHHEEYYRRLCVVRTDGDREGLYRIFSGVREGFG